MLRSLLVGLLLLLASGARGQAPGSCELGIAQGDLDVSNVFARFFNTGSLFFGNTTTNGDGYLVPRVTGNSPLLAAGLWLGGIADDTLRVAGTRYGNFTFWPGPLNEDGTLPDPDDCSAFDRIYVVSVADVDQYEASGEASAALRDWPVGLGAPGVDASGQPLAVTSRDQTLDLGAGERPVLYGSQTAWWVMNDVGGPHSVLGTPPLGVEVRVSAFAIASDDVLGAPEATFYRYEILNRSAHTIEDFRASFFVDSDLGAAGDDYVHSDSTRGLVMTYNEGDIDAAYGIPPAIGFDLLNGANASSYIESLGTSGPTTDPSTGEGMYNFMRGTWGDGSPVRENGNGFEQPATFPITRYVFPGDPVTGQGWSEENNDGNGTRSGSGDRRMVISAPATTLASGERRVIDLGILFARGTDRLNSVTALRDISDAVQAAYDDESLFTIGGEVAFLPPPAILTPEDGEDLRSEPTITFEWRGVPGAQAYQIKWGTSPDDLRHGRLLDEPSAAIPVTSLFSGTQAGVVYWQVKAIANGAVGSYSEVRSVTVYRDGLLILADGSPAYVEVANSAGTDPCAPEATSPDGCDEVGGNLVYHSLNSDGSYYFSGRGTGSESQLGQFAPNDFEIRFTEEGSVAAYLFQSPWNAIRVPFEIWDIGSIVPGEPNDPSDDVRLLPYLFADNGGTCAFNPGEIPDGSATIAGYVETDRIYAFYPATSYADVEAELGPLVTNAPGGCYASNSPGAIFRGADALPIRRQVFGSLATAPALPATGTVIRMYTTGPRPVAADPPPEASGGIALTVGPNPTRGAATVRLTLASPEAVRVRVLDMLGREVAVLAEWAQASGEAVFKIPGGLASGVYAVEASAGEQRTTRLITVIR